MKHVYRQSAYVFGKKMYFLVESYQKPIVSCLKKAWLGGFACDLIGWLKKAWLGGFACDLIGWLKKAWLAGCLFILIGCGCTSNNIYSASRFHRRQH
jgi:hypothetical protein